MVCRSNDSSLEQSLCTFRLEGIHAAAIALVGSFNNWSTTANLMQYKNGRWEIQIPLPPGRHEYCFFILERDDSRARSSIVQAGSVVDVKLPIILPIPAMGENFATPIA